MALNDKIYIGDVDNPTLTFDTDQLEHISCENSVDIVGNELSSDVLEFSVFYDDTNSTLRSQPYGTLVYYYSNNTLVGKYYIYSIKREGVTRYTVQCTSLIGLIENEDFYGGFYDGDQFSDVLNDILFMDSVSLTKWRIMEGATNPSGGSLYPARIYGDGKADVKYFDYGMYVDFEVNDFGSSTSTTTVKTVAGYERASGSNSHDINIKVNANRASTSSPTYWSITARYKTYTVTLGADEPLFGDGTRFIVTIDSANYSGDQRYLKVVANYIKYDDRSVAGTVSGQIAISNVTQSNIANLGYAFGAVFYRSATSYQARLIDGVIYYAYKLYDESGKLVLDTCIAQNEQTQSWYTVNKCTGYAVQDNTHIAPYGEVVGRVGSLSRIERDLTLQAHIKYGNGVESTRVYGWIGKTTRREALHQLLFANNISMLRTDDGDDLFTKLSNSSGDALDELNFYDDSAEEFITGAKQIQITEHSYEESGESKKLFDNTSLPATDGQYIAMFDNAPIYGTPVASGLTIVSYNCNAAVCTGRGTITGTPYNHYQSVIKYNNDNLVDGTELSVSNIGLITSTNSDNVMNKMKAYYSGEVKKITNSLVYGGERCGRKYSFKNLFSDDNTGFLSKISSQVSSFIKAVCTFISGYVPPTSTGYNSFAIILNGEEWTVPAEVLAEEYPSVRLNIIGKGSNGTAGANGANGVQPSWSSGSIEGGDGGAGGAAGIGGDGGAIYSVTLDVSSVAKIGAASSSNNMLARTYNSSGTQLNSYSSASGVKNEKGFTNIFTGIVYARKGLDGHKGGDGGKGGYYSGQIVAPTKGEDVDVYKGGTGGACIVKYVSNTPVYNSFGGGGGAAYGNNGADSQDLHSNGGREYIEWTQGGMGADAVAPSGVYTEYGSGGFGGNGGGGGGGGGTIYLSSQDRSESQMAGLYGKGSAGTSGIQGCVIIYY